MQNEEKTEGEDNEYVFFPDGGQTPKVDKTKQEETQAGDNKHIQVISVDSRACLKQQASPLETGSLFSQHSKSKSKCNTQIAVAAIATGAAAAVFAAVFAL